MPTPPSASAPSPRRFAAETAAAEGRIAEARARALADLREVAVGTMQAAAQKLTGLTIDGAAAGATVDAVMRERA